MNRKKIFSIISILFTLILLIGATVAICTPNIEIFPATVGLLVAVVVFIANIVHVWKSYH